MPENYEIADQLKRITESDQFSRSGINVSLITLLVNATINGHKLKEAEIGTEIFGKSYDPIKNDTKVRVYIHNLRKKLTEYYLGSGKNDSLMFEIEKGQYSVKFLVPGKEKKKLLKSNRLWATVAFLLSLFCIGGYFVWKATSSELPIWEGYIHKTFPTSVLIGDHFTIEGPIPIEGGGLIRAFSINSDADFANYIQRHPEKASSMSPNRYSYVTKMGPYCTKTIGNFFNNQKIPYELMLNSEWDKSKIGSENIIYVGQFKTMGFLRNVYNNFNRRISIEGGIVKVTSKNNKESKTYYSHTGSETIDYTIVSKIRGPNKNVITMFLSDNDIGVISVLNYFTNTDSLKSFNRKYRINDSEFTALFKVSGWERTGYTMSLELIDIKHK